MNYPAAVDFLMGRTDYERWPGYAYANRFDLRRMEELLEPLGNPHIYARTVHIAGSKGKGSTAAMIAAGLRAAGYQTGLYTSPHLLTLRERINVDGTPISKRELAAVVATLRPVVEAVDKKRTYGELTTFELLTTAAFVHFRQKRIEYQVLETGLGGRLDATNVVSPDICVITTIGLDHREVLGNTIASIASEKAGIIKPGCMVISSPQVEEATRTIREVCLRNGVKLLQVGTDISWKLISYNLSGQSLEVNGLNGSYDLRIPLLGQHQLQNAATAAVTLECLGLSREIIKSGMACTSWPGRLQILKRRPMLIIDGAHTSDSARKLREALEQYFHFARLIFIIGTSSDKDTLGIAAELAPLAGFVIATRSRHPRATNPELVAGEFARHGAATEVVGDVALAVEKAKGMAGKKDIICATGSLFLIAEVIEYSKGLRPEVYPQ